MAQGATIFRGLHPSRAALRWITIAGVAMLASCATLRESRGPGEIVDEGEARARPVRADDVALPAGYRIEAVATGLTFPTAVAFDDAGRVHVIEAGYAPGDELAPARLLRVDAGGRTRVVATGERAPWTGMTFHQGAFYVAASGAREGAGQILRITADGTVTPIVQGLPSFGDHPASGPVVGPDGSLYFGVGTATNAGVVGQDNLERGWARRHPGLHDVPCKDTVLMGYNYRTPDPRTGAQGEVATGAFAPYGARTESGEVIPGRVPCSGGIFRVPLVVGARGAGGVGGAGGAPELVAWGFRNPYGLAFSADGRLFATDSSPEPRGSRPVRGAADFLWEVTAGRWYGWPDFAGGEPVYRRHAGSPEPAARLFATHPDIPPRPAARLAPEAGAGRLDFARGAAFGFAGEAFVAQPGDLSPEGGQAPGGVEVTRVNVETGATQRFAWNKAGARGGLARPVDARFDPSGEALYVVDFGVVDLEGAKPDAAEGTGVLWRITRAR